MKWQSTLLALMPALLLFACDRAVDRTVSRPTGGAPAPVPPDGPSTGPADSKSSGVDPIATDAGSTPDPTPPPLTSDAEAGFKGARNLLLTFARAIETKSFDQAWTMLAPTDREKWSRAEFAGMFADLGAITITVPDGSSDAGAGSLFYVAPIAITATDGSGRPVRLEGEARLRRVNNVDGASAAQLRWHFEQLTLDWTH